MKIHKTGLASSSKTLPSSAKAKRNTSKAPVDVWDPYEDPKKRLQRALRPEVVRHRLQEGRKAHRQKTGVVPEAVPQYFRTYEQVKAALYELAKRYPDLVEVQVAGPSGEKTRGQANRDVLVLRLTNKKSSSANKPKVLHLGGEHAREIANPELLLKWADDLLKGYGKDAQATTLLDERIIDIIPIANPDGHAAVERGFAGATGGNLWHRKTTTAPDGVDPNRNFPKPRWGGPGAGTSPYSETYRGPTAGSEPEVQAITKLFEQNHYSLFVTWHSHSELVLYSWGDTRNKTPHDQGLSAIAKRIAGFNGYTPQQSIELYATSGTSLDHFYSLDGKPSFVLETGRSFHQSDEEFARVCKENLPALTYFSTIANDPYNQVHGPEINAPEIDAQGVLRANAKHFFDRTIAGAEVVVDPHLAPGQGAALAAADGAFDSPEEAIVGKVTPTFGPLPTLVFVRARDKNGHWGPLMPVWLKKPAQIQRAA